MNKLARFLALLCALLPGAAISPRAWAEAPMGAVTIELPAERAQYKHGPGVDVVQKKCIACHSADYVYMQPPLTEAQWRAIVTKMKYTMKAPINDEDVDTIVQYLMSQNGKP